MGEELDTLKSALDQVTMQSINMQAEVIARVGHKLQAHTAQQHCQAEVSTRLQAQDKELRDQVLALERLLEKADVKYLEQQQAHRNKLATVLDEMKRSREEIRELAPSAKNILSHVLHTYLPVSPGNTISPYTPHASHFSVLF